MVQPARERSLSVVDRVLALRRRLKIDKFLYSDDAEVTHLHTETSNLSVPLPNAVQYADNSREWLAWSQSPNDGTPTEQSQQPQQQANNGREWLAWSQSPNDGNPPGQD